MVLIVAVFGVIGSMALVKAPQLVIATFALIGIELLFGWLVNSRGVALRLATICALGANLFFIILGYSYPVLLPAGGVLGLSPIMFWFIILMLYAGIASLLPVHLLLQPRDYISTFKLYAVLVLGILGIAIVRPAINAPLFTASLTSGGPIWPMLFVIVACGAISGFHSLVSSGTSSKQLAKESDGKAIGYGAMLVEGVLATLTLVVVSGGLFWTLPQGLDAVRFSFQEVDQ